MHHTLSILRCLNHQTFVSENQIAQQFNLACSDVYSVLQESKQYGVSFEFQPRLGYRLCRAINWLDRTKVVKWLGPVAAHYTINVALEVSSTNTVLRTDPTVPDGTVLAAEWQTHGKGRLGKQWQSVLGGSLLFSIKKIFPQNIKMLSGLSLAIGVAIVRTLKSMAIKGVMLKWPNDIMCAAGKLGGILVETKEYKNEFSEVVIGIGLNLDLARHLKADYADLKSLGMQQDRHYLWATLLIYLHEAIAQFQQHGLTHFIAEWQKAHIWQNCIVNVIQAQRIIASGQVQGITQNGALRLKIDEKEQHFLSGDVSLRKSL